MKKVMDAITYIESLDLKALELGKYIVNDDFFFLVQEYENHEEDEMRYEAHKQYIDIQYIVEGEEKVYIASIDDLEIDEEYSQDKDVMFFKEPENACFCVLRAGSYVVLYPKDGHKPGIKVDQVKHVRKVVGKVRLWNYQEKKSNN